MPKKKECKCDAEALAQALAELEAMLEYHLDKHKYQSILDKLHEAIK